MNITRIEQITKMTGGKFTIIGKTIVRNSAMPPINTCEILDEANFQEFIQQINTHAIKPIVDEYRKMVEQLMARLEISLSICEREGRDSHFDVHAAAIKEDLTAAEKLLKGEE